MNLVNMSPGRKRQVEGRIVLWLMGVLCTATGGCVLLFFLFDFAASLSTQSTSYHGQPVGGIYVLLVSFVMVLFGVTMMKRLSRSAKGKNPVKKDDQSY